MHNRERDGCHVHWSIVYATKFWAILASSMQRKKSITPSADLAMLAKVYSVDPAVSIKEHFCQHRSAVQEGGLATPADSSFCHLTVSTLRVALA